MVMQWPSQSPLVKFSFGKFQQVGSFSGQTSYICDVIVENLTDKRLRSASFNVYGNDKNDIRIGEGTLYVSDLDGGQQAKIRFEFASVGFPVSWNISAGLRAIPTKVLSVPPGAALKVDGQDAGVTPVIVRLTVGNHTLDLTKEGYAAGHTPLEVTSEELPGGSITIELGGLSRDTIELRDGTVLLGDVLSVSLTSVVVSIDGKQQALNRNQVKKVMLVERQVTEQHAVVQPATNPPQPK